MAAPGRKSDLRRANAKFGCELLIFEGPEIQSAMFFVETVLGIIPS